ncbi:hypothetical protein COU18_01125 [Candidatus Kaiserbacteria bacterium CG10_big_fil_rev_8_21_14_0_10_51_14]|uniref:Glycosyltransferase 2-like domain-containing protein n=1 Tax=Candidatus Kaiserbacteria bacterium CG10_big_fil_rev_8_21_14_0_10_51_14 TaxID=1974610 RepID=A0A2H0UC38_9BACT|nr:MAG: hypothetical protein COU18_01125 [Candidatus Kaiserbacteria bacterium CG10_big_fil_rev_8_21_14_0_10_51_14]
MVSSLAPNQKASKIGFKSFVVPARHARTSFAYEQARACVIIPTYAPGELTRRLVEDLLRWNPNIFVYVVDDSTPKERLESVSILRELLSFSRVTLLRTPENKLKAGALNYALQHIYTAGREYTPDVILTVDDDVVIDSHTIKNLVIELMSNDTFGAVCSQCRVYNKNKNLLTRLQGLEYLGFNAIRLADEGFLNGPLVMHGMLTAFRASALQEVERFMEGHLIEDYEITARLKVRGWSVKSAQNAPAWTMVPETFRQLWRQRTRWSYGGVTVVAASRHPASIFQDVLGHLVFLSAIGMILLLYFTNGNGLVPGALMQWIIGLSLLQLGIWYVFQIWLMRLYKEKDGLDWFLRLTLIPEFIYSNVMTLALVGSYIFFSFNVFRNIILSRAGFLGSLFSRIGDRFFRLCGYMEHRWGTRTIGT